MSDTGRRLARMGAAITLGCGLSGCTLRVLDPTGPVGMQERTILLNATIVMLVIIVPTMLATLAVAWWYRPGNPRAVRRPHWSFSGRIEIVTWSIPLLAILFLGRHRMDRSHDLVRANPCPEGEAARGRGRLARLEVAVPLSRGAGREPQPAGDPGRPAGPTPPHLGERVERVLRARARLDDLHDERDGDPAQPRGGSRGDLPRAVDASERRRLLGHDLRDPRGAGGTPSPPGSAARKGRPTPSTTTPTGPCRGRAATIRRRPTGSPTTACSTGSSRRRSRRDPGRWPAGPIRPSPPAKDTDRARQALPRGDPARPADPAVCRRLRRPRAPRRRRLDRARRAPALSLARVDSRASTTSASASCT